MSKEHTTSSTNNHELSLTRTVAKDSEKELVNVLESMGDAFVLVDKDYTILRLNKMQEKLSQVKRKDALGKNFWDVYEYAAGFDSPCWTNYQKAMKTKRPVHFVHYSEPHDVWTEIDAFPTDTGGLSIFLRDISDRKRAEEAAKYSQNNLEYLAEVGLVCG